MDIAKAIEELKSLSLEENSTTAPFEERDLKLLATTKVKLSQNDILKMHVKNWSELDLKQRRKVMGHINAQRSMHAKEIFLKELSTIGKRMRK